MASFLKRYWYPCVLLPLTLISDGGSVIAAYTLSYWLRSLVPNELPELQVYLTLATLNTLALIGVLAALGLYHPSRRESRFEENITALVGLGLALAIVLVGVFFIRPVSFSRLVVAYTILLTGLFIVLGRLSLRFLTDWGRKRGYGLKYVLILGTSPQAQEVVQRLANNPGLGYRVRGHVRAQEEDFSQLPILGEMHELDQILMGAGIDEVWSALGDLPRAYLAQLLTVLQGYPEVQLRFVPGVVELMTTNFAMTSLGGVPLLSLRATPLRRLSNRMLKRTLDAVLSLTGLLLLSPLLLLIAFWIALDSRGGIFYRQERLSRDGESFYIYKFRSMHTDAESRGPGWTRPDDQRVTRAGQFLRRTSLDELPQLLNVLLGDMSLVGPRPERPYYVEQFQQDIPKYIDRHLVKTGITGWAQVHGLRGDTSIPERVRYDLYYIENWSLLLDLRILLMTCWQMFRGQYNAY